jgi:predicted NBD/HSP70 family sugar kinase
VVLAVEIEVDSVAVATVGLGGHIFGEVRQANPPNVGPEDVVSRLSALAELLLSELAEEYVLVGVGVAVAGVVRRSDGFVHTAPNLQWRDIPMGVQTRRGPGFQAHGLRVRGSRRWHRHHP